jgi:hypothetical protein
MTSTLPRLTPVSDESATTLAALLDRIADRVAETLAGATCQHCGRPPFSGGAADVRAGTASPPPGRGRTCAELDEVDEEERRLWRLLAEAERTFADAPPRPAADQLAAARAAVAEARRIERSLTERLETAETALASPLSWFRITYRLALTNQAKTSRASLATIRAKAEQATARVQHLEAQHAKYRAYLTEHRPVLDAARAARDELDRRVDDLLQGYAALPQPPAWFRLGLAYPPPPEAYDDWLPHARMVLSYRRRYGITHTMEPLGLDVPQRGTAQYRDWQAAQGLDDED